MQKNAQVGWMGRLSVAQKLAILPLVLVLSTAAILAYTVHHLNDFKDDAATVHLISRVRVLNSMYLNRVVGVTKAAGSVQESDLVQLMTDSLQALRDGGWVKAFLGSTAEITADPAPNAEIREELTKNLAKVQGLVKLSEQFHQLSRDDASYPQMQVNLQQASEQIDESLRDAVKKYTEHSEAQIAAMINAEVIAIAVVAVLGFFLAWLISREVAKPLNELVILASAIADGNLKQDKLQVNSIDEIGKLGGVFNVMVAGLTELAGQNLSVAKNLGSSAAQVLASIQQQAAATKQQAASVQETTTTMEEINQTGVQISERAKQVIVLAEEAASSGRIGLDAVQSTNQTMVAIREQVEAVAEKIVTLSERTQAVGEIISTVNDIAEQSNLLALNAAIEAAAAGEHGRSFTVVANEIKNLADQAKESTIRVRSILGDIQTGINSSVMLTEEAVKRVESGKQQADVAERTIMQMTGTSKESTSAFHQIVGATSQQQIGFEQITIALKSITTGAEQTAASTNQLEKAAINLNAVGQQLQRSVERYRI